jgi:hypothetical protein
MRSARKVGSGDQMRAEAKLVEIASERQAALVVAAHSTDAEDCIELLKMLGLRDTAPEHETH